MTLYVVNLYLRSAVGLLSRAIGTRARSRVPASTGRIRPGGRGVVRRASQCDGRQRPAPAVPVQLTGGGRTARASMSCGTAAHSRALPAVGTAVRSAPRLREAVGAGPSVRCGDRRGPMGG